ncbi:MAG: class I SAM-dependent methyltransferase [Gaiellaceae bacterium]
MSGARPVLGRLLLLARDCRRRPRLGSALGRALPACLARGGGAEPPRARLRHGTRRSPARLRRLLTALDLSTEAIRRAGERYGDLVDLAVADVTQGLPAPDGSCDAVMANVSLHMFPTATTSSSTTLHRVLRPGGLSSSTSTRNARADRELRARRRSVARARAELCAREHRPSRALLLP